MDVENELAALVADARATERARWEPVVDLCEIALEPHRASDGDIRHSLNCKSCAALSAIFALSASLAPSAAREEPNRG